jgi:hypothetical protein
MRLALQLHLTKKELRWYLLRGLLGFNQENLLHQPTKMRNKQRLMMLKRSRTGHKLLPLTRRLRLAVATIPGIDCKYTHILLNPKAHKAPGVKNLKIE